MTLIEKPVAGQPMRAGWGASVAERLNQIGAVGAPRQLVMEGPFGQGIAPLPKNQRDRRGAPVAPQPYEVRWDPALADGDGGWKIFLPGSHLLRVDDEYIDELGGVTAIEDDNGDETGWYEFAEIDSSATAIWLVITTEDSGNREEVTAEFADDENEGADHNICIAELSGTAVNQSTVGAIELGSRVEPDGKSIDASGGEGADQLQIKDFNSDESDSPKGLVERLQADPESGKVSAKEPGGLMLLARRSMNDGSQKIVYIPLTATGEDPEDEEGEHDGGDTCEHPEGGGGVVANADDDHGDAGGASGGGGGFPTDGGGGVVANGDTHLGNDGCNCN